jgi:hypothetical protein
MQREFHYKSGAACSGWVERQIAAMIQQRLA